MDKQISETAILTSNVLRERFWSYVDKSAGPEECWNWTGSTSYFGKTNKHGYGRLCWAGKFLRANRLAFTLANGEIPKGKDVCHTCDNPACVNPKHLFAGTHRENILDASRKGRMVNRDSPQKKLTLEDVEWARQEYYLVGNTTMKALAKQLNISSSHMTSVLSGKYWPPMTCLP